MKSPPQIRRRAEARQSRTDQQKVLIEQYKLVRSSITDLQNDRNTNNNFLIAIVTLIVGGEAYLLKAPIESSGWPLSTHLIIVLAFIAVIGVLLCEVWERWIGAYRIALKVRYTLLVDMEVDLPDSPFTKERTHRDDKDYKSITSIIGQLARLFRNVFLIQLYLLLLFAVLGG